MALYQLAPPTDNYMEWCGHRGAIDRQVMITETAAHPPNISVMIKLFPFTDKIRKGNENCTEI